MLQTAPFIPKGRVPKHGVTGLSPQNWDSHPGCLGPSRGNPRRVVNSTEHILNADPVPCRHVSDLLTPRRPLPWVPDDGFKAHSPVTCLRPLGQEVGGWVGTTLLSCLKGPGAQQAAMWVLQANQSRYYFRARLPCVIYTVRREGGNVRAGQRWLSPWALPLPVSAWPAVTGRKLPESVRMEPSWQADCH